MTRQEMNKSLAIGALSVLKVVFGPYRYERALPVYYFDSLWIVY